MGVMAPVRVFISHASPDTPFAERLATDLRSAGADVWIDATHLAGTGGDFLARISRALSDRDVLVLVLSPAAVASQWVPDEMNAAILQYKEGFMQAPLIVVAEPVSSQRIPGLWKIYNRIDATQNYQAALKLVFKSLGLALPQEPPSAPAAGETTPIPHDLQDLPPVRPARPEPMHSPHLTATSPTPATTSDPAPPASTASTTSLAPRASTASRASTAPRASLAPPAIAYRAQAPVATTRRTLKLGPVIAVAVIVALLVGILAWMNLGTHPGSVRWTYQTGNAVASTPAIASGIVYVGSNDGHLYALDATHGSQRWQVQTGASVGSPVVADGVVYVGSANQGTYAINAQDGSVKWHVQIGDGVLSYAPAVANGLVYVGSNDHDVYALNAADGSVHWKAQTGDGVQSRLVVANGLVYAGSLDSSVYAMDAATGSIKWKFPTKSFVDIATVANGLVYVDSAWSCANTTSDTVHACVYALDALTGATRWQFQTSASFSFSSSAVANGALYVSSDDGYVVALNATTGSLRWKVLPGGGHITAPLVAGSTLYVGSDDHSIYALSATDGSTRWSYQTSGPIGWSPAVANGLLYVGSGDDHVYALTA